MAGYMFSQRQLTWDCKLMFVQSNYENKVRAEATADTENPWNDTQDVEEIVNFVSVFHHFSLGDTANTFIGSFPLTFTFPR